VNNITGHLMTGIGVALAHGDSVDMQGWTMREKRRAVMYAARVLNAGHKLEIFDAEELAIMLEEIHEQCGWPHFPPYMRRIMEKAKKAAAQRRSP